MPAAKAIRALLTGASAVTALVPAARIYPLSRPQGESALPALIVSRISSVPVPAVGMATQQRVSRDRVEVTALAADYASLTALVRAVDQACTCKSGTLASVQVQLIERDLVGPDQVNEELGIYSRDIDFAVTYFEP